MSKKLKADSEIKFCPLLDKNCIQEDCGWFLTKLKACAVQVVPYNLYIHSNKLEESSKNYEILLDYLTRPARRRG